MNESDTSCVNGLARSLGELIGEYRKRKSSRIHNGLCWSQEALALAIGTSQARISQIESDRSHPQYLTLARISDALGLTEDERKELLILAGYLSEPALPDERAVASVVVELAPDVDNYPYPAAIMDEGERIWHWNPLQFFIWGPCYHVANLQQFKARLKGKSTIEVLFDPEDFHSRYQVWATYIEDIENLITRLATIFWRVYRLRPHDPKIVRTLSRLIQNPNFYLIWQQVKRGERNVRFLEHSTQVARNQQFGRLQFHVWRTHPAIDGRFIVVHFTPADGSTQEVLRQLIDRRGGTDDTLARTQSIVG